MYVISYMVECRCFNFFSLNIADLEELKPALNLLCSAIRENDMDPHFSEQLLNLTLTFLTKQLEEIFVYTDGKITRLELYVVM